MEKRIKLKKNYPTSKQAWRNIAYVNGLFLYEISGREVPKKELKRRGLI